MYKIKICDPLTAISILLCSSEEVKIDCKFRYPNLVPLDLFNTKSCVL